MELPSSLGSKSIVPMSSYVAGVLQPERAGIALNYNIADNVVNYLLDSVMQIVKKPAVAAHMTKSTSPVTGPRFSVPEEDKWIEDMLFNNAILEKKYSAKDKPVYDDGVIFSRGSNSNLSGGNVGHQLNMYSSRRSRPRGSSKILKGVTLGSRAAVVVA